MGLRRAAAAVYWTFSRWTYTDTGAPIGPAGIMVAAPHTSNWDFLLMLGIAWRNDLNLKVLVKKEWFRRRPVAWVMRGLGGIPVDRENPAGLIDSLAQRAADGEQFHLVITPEGTRNSTTGWRSGFYRLARETSLPVTLGFVDRRTMTSGLGPTFELSGDVSADMDRIRDFFGGMVGVNAGREAEPRLSSEG